MLLGAKPILVDVEPDTCNLDPRLLERAITPRTRTIMPVALSGNRATWTRSTRSRPGTGSPSSRTPRRALVRLTRGARAARSRLSGARASSRRSHSAATATAAPSSPTTPPSLRRSGRSATTGRRAAITTRGSGSTAGSTRVQCAVLLAKLERFDWEVEQRQVVARRYDSMLAGLEPAGPHAPGPSGPAERVRPVHGALRRPVIERRLKAASIPTAVHYPVSLHQQPAYGHLFPGARFPVSEALAREVLSLPMHPYLGEPAQRRIADALRAQRFSAPPSSSPSASRT